MRGIKQEFKVLSPTGILGYGFPEQSFRKGIAAAPDLIGVDAGSTDPGPYYLGSGKSFTNRTCVKRDLRLILVEGVKRRIPVVIGSAGGSGAAPHLQWCREIIEEIAAEEKLAFRLGVVAADIPRKMVLAALRKGGIKPLSFVPALTEADLAATTNIVAQMGVEPLIRALDRECDVVLAGRCYDPACFAALPIKLGYDPGLAMHMGKILECAAIAATPGSGADCVLGTLQKDGFILEALNPMRKFTQQSTAAHTLYEKSNPYYLPGPGGAITLENCKFSEIGGGRTRVTGSRFIKSPKYMVKLEGAKRIGFRCISMAATRDPIMIAQIDAILQAVRESVGALLQKENVGGSICFHLYGKNAVMGDREPAPDSRPVELGILIDALAPTQDDADAACGITRSTLLHYGYPGRIATAGNLAFPFSPSDTRMGEVYEFSVYHLMELADQKVFKLKISDFRSGKVVNVYQGGKSKKR